jgi:hypothetical protein
MNATLKSILAAGLVLGSASLALADDGTDTRLDTSRTGYAIQAEAQFQTRAVALPSQGYTVHVDREGANADNGGN